MHYFPSKARKDNRDQAIHDLNAKKLKYVKNQ